MTPSSSPTASTSRKRVVKPPDERRRELLDAGLEVLIEQGYEGATVSAITDRAGVAKGTFYLYFETKAHLLVGLRERHNHEIAEEIATRLSQGPADAWAVMDATFDAFVRFLVEEREVHDVLFDGPGAGVTVPGETDSVAVIADLIRAGNGSGDFAVEDSLMAASLLFYGVHGAVDEALRRGGADKADLQRLARGFARVVLAPGVA